MLKKLSIEKIGLYNTFSTEDFYNAKHNLNLEILRNTDIAAYYKTCEISTDTKYILENSLFHKFIKIRPHVASYSFTYTINPTVLFNQGEIITEDLLKRALNSAYEIIKEVPYITLDKSHIQVSEIKLSGHIETELIFESYVPVLMKLKSNLNHISKNVGQKVEISKRNPKTHAIYQHFKLNFYDLEANSMGIQLHLSTYNDICRHFYDFNKFEDYLTEDVYTKIQAKLKDILAGIFLEDPNLNFHNSLIDLKFINLLNENNLKNRMLNTMLIASEIDFEKTKETLLQTGYIGNSIDKQIESLKQLQHQYKEIKATSVYNYTSPFQELKEKLLLL